MFYDSFQYLNSSTNLIYYALDFFELYNNTFNHLDMLSSLLQTQVLKVKQVNEPCIGLTQENLVENFVQDCLPYILKPHGPC